MSDNARDATASTASAPAVTVLMPTHDRARFIAAAVDSVLAQRFADLELIVIDDGSTDDTLAILAAVGDPRLRVLRRTHGGVRAALNAGLRAARGRYIARNDSDDVWLPDHLATLVPALDSDAALGLVYGRAEMVDTHGARLPGGRGTPLRFPDDPFHSLLHTDYTCPVTSVMRRSAIEGVGGWDESIGTSEDWEMALRIALHHGVRFVDRVVAHVRLHDGNTIGARTYAARALPDRLRILDARLRDPATPPALATLASRFRREIYIGTALQFVDLGRYADALRIFATTVADGGSPLRTCGRIAWRTFSWTVIARHAWSRALAGRLADRWRRSPVERAGARGHSGALP